MNKGAAFLATLLLLSGGIYSPASALDYEEYPSIRLRSLDKITARTLTFDAQVGNTIKFGDIYIKVLSCRKPPPVEKSEAAAFLQIWQIDRATEESRWVFSGWMFASSPALSGMDHPVYDVWVIDCLGKDPEELPKEDIKQDKPLPDEGTVPEGSVSDPKATPEEQKQEEPKDEVIEDVPSSEVIEQKAAPEPKPAPDIVPDVEPSPAAPQQDGYGGIY
jgi:hypothetical protein